MNVIQTLFRQLFQRREEQDRSSPKDHAQDSYFENRIFEIADEHGISPDAVLTMASIAAEEYNHKVAKWRTLTPREQEVAALICIDYTNKEIANHLSISLSTVKTHIRSILTKFDLHSKNQLRQYFDGWDFSHLHH